MAQGVSVDALLLADLQAELKAFQEFKGLLHAEQKALIDVDVDALSALSQAKLDQVAQLNRMANARLDRIASLGLTANRDGVEAWAKTTGVAALDSWRSLLAVASEAHNTNRINGTLIQTNLQHNQQALAVLLAVASKSNLYGPDGQPKNEMRGNNASRGIIGRA